MHVDGGRTDHILKKKSYFLVTLANCYAILAQELGGGACYWGLALAAAATCFPFMQIRTFHHISVLAAVGLLSIFVMLAFVFASLALHPPAGAGYRPGDLWPERLGFWKAWGSISNVVFAFQGQSIFFGERTCGCAGRRGRTDRRNRVDG